MKVTYHYSTEELIEVLCQHHGVDGTAELEFIGMGPGGEDWISVDEVRFACEQE